MVTIWCRECLRAGILIPSAWFGPESIMLGTVEGREVRHSNLRWLHTGGAAQGLALLAMGTVSMVSGPWYPDRGGIGIRGMVTTEADKHGCTSMPS